MRNYANIAADLGSAADNGQHLSHPPDAGVFLENDVNSMPFRSWNSSSYLRDIVFVPAANTIPLPIMGVTGNGNPIPDGYSAPSAGNFTQFGHAAVGGGVEQTFVINNTGTGPLTLNGTPPIAFHGAQAGDFQVTTPPAASVPAGGTTSFTLRFAPTAAGARSALVVIENNDKNPYYFTLGGTGDAPVIVRITSVTADPVSGDVVLQWEGPDATYQVERAASVTGPFTPIGSAQSALTYTDVGVLKTGNASAFYRIRR